MYFERPRRGLLSHSKVHEHRLRRSRVRFRRTFAMLSLAHTTLRAQVAVLPQRRVCAFQQPLWSGNLHHCAFLGRLRCYGEGLLLSYWIPTEHDVLRADASLQAATHVANFACLLAGRDSHVLHCLRHTRAQAREHPAPPYRHHRWKRHEVYVIDAPMHL